MGRHDILSLLLVAGVGLAYQLLFLYQGVGLIDEGHLANAARRIVSGDVLYRDVYSVYPPGSFYAVSWLFELSGPSLIVVRAFHIAMTLALAALVYVACRSLMPAAWATLAGLLVAATGSEAILVGCHYAHLYSAFPIAALLLLWNDEPDGRRAWRLLGVGVLAGLTLAFRLVPFGALMAACLVFLWRSSNGLRPAASALGQILLGIALVWTPIGLFFVLHAAGSDLLRAVFWTSYQQYLSGGEFNLPFPALRLWPEEWTRAGISRLLINWEFYLPIAVYAGAAAELAWRGWRRRREGADAAALRRLTLLVFGAVLFVRVMGRSDYYHLAPVLVPAFMLGADLLARGWRRMLPSGAQRWAPAAVLVVLLLSFWVQRIDHAIARAFDSKARVEISAGGPWVREESVLDDLVRTLRQRSREGEPIVVLPFHAGLYFLADRPNPTKFDLIFPGYLPDEASTRSVIDAIDSSGVRIVVYAPGSIDGRPGRSLADFAPEIDRYIRSHFEPERRFGHFLLMTRRER